MEVIMDYRELKIDKTNWKPVKFGDVVVEPKEICKDIIAEGIEHVVGLEHIDTGDLHLRKSATSEVSTTFSKKFSKGDVLFGRRRAYLKKAAQAEFDGICSGDITVFRAKKELSSALLPFIVNNDKFFDYAVKHSAGGLSPRVKFKDLANYEFLLPPKAEQVSLAELLWAMDNVIEKEKGVLSKCLINKAVFSKDLLLGENELKKGRQSSPYGDIPKSWELIKLIDLRDPTDRYSFTGGPFGSDLKSKDYTSSGVRVLQLQNIGEGEFIDKDSIFTSIEKADQLKSCNIFPNEILLAKMSPVARCCIVPEISDRFVICSDGIRLKVNKSKFHDKFVYHAINSCHFKDYANSKSSGTTRGRIGLNDLKLIPIPIPSKDAQIQISNKLDSIDSLRDSLKVKIISSQSLQKSLINQLF